MFKIEDGKVYDVQKNLHIANIDQTGKVFFLKHMAVQYKSKLEAWMKNGNTEKKDGNTEKEEPETETNSAETEKKDGDPENTGGGNGDDNTGGADNGNPNAANDYSKPLPKNPQEVSGVTDPANPVVPQAPPPAPPESNGKIDVETMPFGMLPKFDRVLGMNTPGLKDFLNYWHLDGNEINKLVKRLEKGY